MSEWLGQNEEDRYVAGYFRSESGRFLDIGAYDGRKFSNTLRLAESGWHGVAVEADPFAFTGLIRNMPNTVACVLGVLAPRPDIYALHCDGGGGVTTTNTAHAVKWMGQKAVYTGMYAAGVTPGQLFAEFGVTPFDFVSLDVEGTNLATLRLLPLGEMRVRMLCVEHDGRQREVIDYAAAHGLTVEITRNAENIIIARP